MIDLDNVELITKSEILSPELIDEIYLEENPVIRQTVIYKLEDRAKVLDVLKRFQSLIKAQEQMIKEQRAELNRKAKQAEVIEPTGNHTKLSVITHSEDDTEVIQTGRWIVNASGVSTYYGMNEVRASHYPIIITQRFIDRETCKEEIEVTWTKDNVVRNMRVPRSTIASATKMVNLADYGFPATSESAKSLITYLADFEALNTSWIKKKTSTSKLGWADKDFMPYSEGDIVFNVPQNFQNLTSAVATEGDYDTWLKAVREIRATRRPEPLVYMAASFGSILVPIINVSPFIVNLYGTSGKGKTVNLMLASSIWANPKGFIAESNSTLNSLEIRLNILNNLPMMIDDLSKIRDRGDGDKYSDMIYMLCSGQGKGRLNKNIEMRETSTWSNAILTNIERPLASEAMQGGAVNRVLDFEIQEGYIFDNANSLVNIVTNNYGFAGREFVKCVQENYDSINAMVEHYENEIKRIANESGHQKEQKQITPLALLLTADELSEQYIFKDGRRLDIHYCVSCLKDVENVSEMDRALRHIEDEVTINRMCYVPDGPDGKYRGSICGFVEDGYVYFIKTAFDKIAEKYDFSAKQFLNWAKNRNLLLTNKDRLDYRKTSPNGLGRKTYYALMLECDGGDDALPAEKDSAFD